MILNVQPADYIKGSVDLPASKSYSIRAFIIASCGGQSMIIQPSDCDDALIAKQVAKSLGAQVSKKKEGQWGVFASKHKRLPKKIFVKETALQKTIDKLLKEIQDALYAKSKRVFMDRVADVKTMLELHKTIADKKIAHIYWCGKEACEETIKEKNGGAKILNIPFVQPKKMDECVCCKKQGAYRVYVAKSY